MAEKSAAMAKDVKEDPMIKVTSLSAGEIETLDASEVFLRNNNVSEEYVLELLADEQAQKRLVRKIDLMVLPLLAGTYTLQYIDKQALSYSAVFDLFTDANITGDQYSWFASIFYLAYLVAEYPWTWLAQKWRMARMVAICVFVWGSILMITAACHDFSGLAACRFFLGVFEAPITTCFMMIVGMWYVRKEQPFRAGVFYCCNGVGSMLGGLLTYGIGQVDTFPVWKTVFLVCGAITVLWSAVLFVFLPDSILSAKRFSRDEKALLIGRARLAHTGVMNQSIKWEQIAEIARDPQVWLVTLFMLLNEVINGGIANFGKLIIKGIVKKPILTVALGIPQGAFQVFFILSGTYLASRFKNCRTLVMAAYLMPTIVGVCLIWKMPRDTETHKIGILFGYYISGAFVTSLVLAMQMPAANLGGYTKRFTASAIVFIAYCAGNVIGPHAFLDSEAPRYPTGCKLIIACAAGQVVIAVLLRCLYIRRNKQRDEAAAAVGHQEMDNVDMADLTDFQNPKFRYVM